MSSISATSANSAGFQQLSALSAKRNADQAAQMAQSLRKQADIAQAQADEYEAKAQSLDSQANKAQVKSDDATFRLNLSEAFQKTGTQIARMVNNEVTKNPIYSKPASGAKPTVNNDNSRLGSSVDAVV